MIDDGPSETPVQHLLLTNIQSWGGGRLNFIKSEERIPANSINKDNNPSQEVSHAQKPCSLTRQEARNPHNIHIGKGSPFLTNTVLQPRATLIGDALRMCGLLSGVRNDCLLLALRPQGISAVVTQWVTVSHESNLAQQSNWRKTAESRVLWAETNGMPPSWNGKCGPRVSRPQEYPGVSDCIWVPAMKAATHAISATSSKC